MQGHYPPAFEREMGCTDAELRAWLPRACGERPIAWAADAARVDVGGGHVTIGWQRLAPRRIALLAVPRLRVRFEALGVDADTWQAFMRRFDLCTQRGGG